MKKNQYQPIFQLTRGEVVESIHMGAVAVVDASGGLIASFGDPGTITYLRSSAKPFQALPLIERDGQQEFGLSLKEIAIICASHSGTDEHLAVLRSIQEKVGVTESDLCCGIHYPLHEPTAMQMRMRQEAPTPLRHNCSGKHTGMLALERLTGQINTGYSYINPEHPIQHMILDAFSDMTSVSIDKIAIGTDGCSVPNFAIPLFNSALAYARLSDPETGQVDHGKRAQACKTIVQAMWSHPLMVGGPARFDSRLMEVGAGRFVSKGGAEGYQGIGILPGVIGARAPGIGIAFKIADGDMRGKVHPAVALEILRQLGVLTDQDLLDLAEFGPSFPLYNWRKILVGEGRPIFHLKDH